MPETTVIRQAAWIVAWDSAAERHVYLRDADVAFTDTAISFVGKAYDGPTDHEIDGRQRLVMPGLVNIHTHPTSEPLRKGITDETHSPGFWHSSLYEFLPIFVNDPAGAAASFSPCCGFAYYRRVKTPVGSAASRWRQGWRCGAACR